MKKQICITLEEDTVEFIDRVGEITGRTKSSSIELLCNIVSTYFSDREIILEGENNIIIDRRKKTFANVDENINAG